MSDLFQETVNESNDEKRYLLFRQYLPIIIGVTIVIAIAMNVYSFYSKQQLEKQQQFSHSLINVGQISDHEAQRQTLQQIINQNVTQSQLARLKLIHDQINHHEIAEALANLEQIAEPTNGTNKAEFLPLTSAYARIVWLNLFLDLPKPSNQQELLAKKYMQYFSEVSQPFYLNATLIKALYYQKQHDLQLARQYAENILKIAHASPILQQQAKSLIANLKY